MDKLFKLAKEIQPEFTSETQGETTVLTLSGSVVGDGWWIEDNDITAKKVRQALDEVQGEIVIKLNSPGGDVFEGIEIYNYLKSLDNHVTVEVTALAASAASIIAMGADELVMCTGSQLMIHEASTLSYGNKKDLQKTLNALETIDESIVSIYQERTEADAETIEEWMTDEIWFTAEEAVEVGLADRCLVEEEPNEEIELLKAEIVSLRNQLAEQPEEKVVAKTVAKTGLNKLFGGV